MLRMVGRRVAVSIVMLTANSLLIFVVLRLLPGDPVITRLGATPGITPEQLDRLRAQAGLDDPIMVQYFHWVGGMLHGDFGTSYFNQFSVTELISQRLPATVELTAISIAFTVAIAVPAALLAVRRPGGLLDRMITTGASAGMALPQFLVGVALIVIFAVHLRWFPSRGYTPISESLGSNLKGLVLPSLTLAIAAAPLLLRFLRASLLEVMDTPYIRTAIGKGVPSRRVLVDHALSNALIPGLTMLGMIVGYTLGGVVIIEYIFGLPGLGSLAVDAVLKRDYAVLQSAVLLIAAMFIATTLLVDILTGVLDPRLRTGARSG
jgi:peptide/nickel transport system permease protein